MGGSATAVSQKGSSWKGNQQEILQEILQEMGKHHETTGKTLGKTMGSEDFNIFNRRPSDL